MTHIEGEPVTTTTPMTTARSRQRRLQLGKDARKGLLSLHIITSVGLLGSDAAVLVLSIAGARGAAPPSVYPPAALLGQWLILPLSVASLATGVALGLLTPWGVLRYYWTSLKLALNSAGLVLAWLVLLPSLDRAADQAHTALSTGLPAGDRLGLVRDSAAAMTVLVVTVLLSVYKPFGRLKLGRVTPGRSACGGPRWSSR